jgi:hypothetical protein
MAMGPNGERAETTIETPAIKPAGGSDDDVIPSGEKPAGWRRRVFRTARTSG